MSKVDINNFPPPSSIKKSFIKLRLPPLRGSYNFSLIFRISYIIIVGIKGTIWKNSKVYHIFAVNTQFKQLRKRSLKKIQASAGFEPVRIPLKPEFFFRLLFRNCLNCVLTAKIFHNVFTHNRGTNPVTIMLYYP